MIGGWRALYRECWSAQADLLRSDNEAVRLGDPRLCHPAAELATGALLDDRALQPISPIHGRVALAEAMAEHEQRRSASVARTLRGLPLHRRLRADKADLEAAYDAEHLLVCPSCALPHNDDDPPNFRYRHVPTCRLCGGPLGRLVEATLPPTLEDSLQRIAARRAQLRGGR